MDQGAHVPAEPGDLAVTADIPLASRLVEKQVLVIDPRGEEYTEENVGDRLAVRDLMNGLQVFPNVIGLLGLSGVVAAYANSRGKK